MKKKTQECMPLVTRIILGIVGVLVICAIAFFAYVGDYYRADDVASAAMESSPTVSVVDEAGSSEIVFMPHSPQAVLVFYPGGKVECAAYAPLLHALAERGIACVLVDMPFNLAVFNVDAADDARSLPALADLPADTPWYIGGHSLGGSMAAAHLASHADDFAGLVLLASYSTEDLSGLDLDAISVYGTCDEVLNAEKYAANFGNLGANASELVLEGGNHAQFGSYGAQEGDGMASINAEAQRELTADYVAERLLLV